MDRHPLDGVWARLGWADQHADALKYLIGQFLDHDPYRIVSEQDPHTGECLLRAQVLKPPPTIEWGLRLGDILHNFRSALDHLVWQLALAHRPDREPPPRTEFPIFIDRELFAAERRKKIGGLSSRAQEIIERLQPYNRSELPESDPLWYLHELNRTDKHRVLHVVSAAIPTVSFTADELIAFRLEPGVFAGVSTFDHNDVIARLPPHPRCLELAEKLHFSFGIAFDPKGPARGMPIDNALEWWGTWLPTELVPQFSEFFPPQVQKSSRRQGRRS